MMPAVLSFWAMAATPLPCWMLTLTVLPAEALPLISFRMASRQLPAASTRISSTIKIIFAAPPFLLFLCFASCAMYTLLYHSVQLSIISRI